MVLGSGFKVGTVLKVYFRNGKKEGFACTQVPLREFKKMKEFLSGGDVAFETGYNLD